MRTYPAVSVRFVGGPLTGQQMVLEWARIRPPLCVWVEVVDGRPGRSMPCNETPETTDGWVRYRISVASRVKPGEPHDAKHWPE